MEKRNREALELQTLPRYIYYEGDQPKNALQEIKFWNLRVQDLIDRMKQLFGSSLDYQRDVLYPWIAYSPELQELPKAQRTSFLFGVERSTNIEGLITFSSNEVPSWKKEFQAELKSFEAKTKIQENLLDTVVDEIPPFEIKKVQRLVELNRVGTPSADFLLDMIECSADVPFARTTTYSKFYTRTRYDPKWDELNFPDDPGALLVVSNGDEFLFLIQEDNIQLFYNVDVDTFEKEQEKVRVVLSSLFISSFTIKDTRLTGDVVFEDMSFQPNVLSDICFTDDSFRNYLVINEKQKTTRLRKSNLFLHFRSEETGLVTFSMVQRGTAVRLRISRIDSEASVKLFLLRFSQLMKRYTKLAPQVIREYRKYFPDFATQADVAPLDNIRRNLGLKEIAPDLFLPKYTRKCTYLPSIVSPEEKIPEDAFVMTFPKTPQEGTQHRYYCPHPEAPFPGLRKNPMENKDKYPFIPCCYVDDQREKKNSAFNQYYEGASANKQSNIQRILTTYKFVSFDQLGVIPSNFSKLFSIFAGKPIEVYRTGVSYSQSSLLECLLMKVNNKYSTMQNREEFLNKERQSLLEEELEICRQVWWEKPIEFLEMLIADPDRYLDPRYVLPLLEKKYNCNCIVLTRSEKGYLDVLSPPYAKYMAQYQDNRRQVYIYEHWGSESDMATMPRCELLLVDDISPSIKEIYNIINQFYIDGTLVHPMSFSCPKRPTHQMIDQFGKLRGIHIKWSGGVVTLYTPPLPPLALPIDNSVYTAKIDDVSALVLELGISNTIETEKGVYGLCGDVQVEIPFFTPEQNSSLRDFITAKRQANYYIQITRYLFSKFLAKREILTQEEEWVENESMFVSFMEDTFRVDPTTVYSSFVPLTFENVPSTIVVKDDETVDRLMYDLLRFTTQHMKRIEMYLNLEFIPKDFDQVSDFKRVADNLVVRIEP